MTLIEAEKIQRTDVELTMLDYNVDPICNAKCIICSSFFSSAWAAEDIQFGRKISRRVAETQKNNVDELLDLSALTDVYFNGGEPLMTKDHIQILNSINQQSDLSCVTISYNTNGSILPTEEILELWKKCQSVKLYFSIDGTDSVFNYTRYPLKWINVQDNINKICSAKLDNLTISISYTIGIHNILSVIETEKWMNSLKEQFPSVVADFTVHPVIGDLSLDNASTSLKKVFLNNLQKSDSDWANATQQILQNTTSSTADNSVWLEYLKFIDQRRNLNWQQELPLLHQALKISGLL
jgi:sulfatase maturation enzyme AslB (radical SAM superfamily)